MPNLSASFTELMLHNITNIVLKLRNPDFNGYGEKLPFWGRLDVTIHFAKIYRNIIGSVTRTVKEVPIKLKTRRRIKK